MDCPSNHCVFLVLVSWFSPLLCWFLIACTFILSALKGLLFVEVLIHGDGDGDDLD